MADLLCSWGKMYTFQSLLYKKSPFVIEQLYSIFSAPFKVYFLARWVCLSLFYYILNLPFISNTISGEQEHIEERSPVLESIKNSSLPDSHHLHPKCKLHLYSKNPQPENERVIVSPGYALAYSNSFLYLKWTDQQTDQTTKFNCVFVAIYTRVHQPNQSKDKMIVEKIR